MGQRKRKRNQWLQRHRADGFVKRAAREGARSRAAYKLMDIDQRDHLLKPAMAVVELGAAPGGWSQYVASRVGGAGTVVAMDLLAMEPVSHVHFIQGDFTEPSIQTKVIEALGERTADLVISDIAPKITGIDAVDQAQGEALLDAVLGFSVRLLRPGGSLLIKVFESQGAQAFRRRCEQRFQRCWVRKPTASRARSREYYLVARGFSG